MVHATFINRQPLIVVVRYAKERNTRRTLFIHGVSIATSFLDPPFGTECSNLSSHAKIKMKLGMGKKSGEIRSNTWSSKE